MDSFNFISDCEGVISDSIYVRFISFVQSIENKDTFVSYHVGFLLHTLEFAVRNLNAKA